MFWKVHFEAVNSEKVHVKEDQKGDYNGYGNQEIGRREKSRHWTDRRWAACFWVVQLVGRLIVSGSPYRRSALGSLEIFIAWDCWRQVWTLQKVAVILLILTEFTRRGNIGEGFINSDRFSFLYFSRRFLGKNAFVRYVSSIL